MCTHTTLTTREIGLAEKEIERVRSEREGELQRMSEDRQFEMKKNKERDHKRE